jgi:5'-nucleotidase
LTTADGIEAAGLHALVDALDGMADMTVVAPNDPCDHMGRTVTPGFGVSTHEAGYAVDGTPSDAIHFGRTVIEASFDAIVVGCHNGPTLGAHQLGRSGTVGAAIEASFLGIPAVAFSLYDPAVGQRPFSADDFTRVKPVARLLLEQLIDGLPDGCDYLNVNVPTVTDASLRITRPVQDFDIDIERHADGYHVRDQFYQPLASEADIELADSVGTDRRAAADGEISISPLTVKPGTPSLDMMTEVIPGYADRQ